MNKKTFIKFVTALILASPFVYAALPSGYQVAINTWFDFSGGAGKTVIYSPDGVSLVISPDAGFSQNVTVTGTLTTGAQVLAGNETVNGNLIVNGDAGISDNMSVCGGRGVFSTEFVAQGVCNDFYGTGSVFTSNNMFISGASGTNSVGFFNFPQTDAGGNSDFLFAASAAVPTPNLCFDGTGSDSNCSGAGVVWKVNSSGQTTQNGGAILNTGTSETNLVPTVSFFQQVGPGQTLAIECGSDAGTTGALAVATHFANVGAMRPVCWCNEENAAQKACNPSVQPTATVNKFIDEGGGSDIIDWCCIGPK